MTVLRNVIEIIIVTFCLPFYAVVFPLTRWGQRSAARRIEPITCPACGELFADITHDLAFCGVRLRLTAGTRVQWDRLPKWRVTCKSCGSVTCFDNGSRVTACDMSDAITRARGKAKPSSSVR